MSHGFDGSCSADHRASHHHHHLLDNNPIINPSYQLEDFIGGSSGIRMLSSSGIFDFDEINANHSLLHSHLHLLPSSPEISAAQKTQQQLRDYQFYYQINAATVLGLEIAAHDLPPWPPKVEGGSLGFQNAETTSTESSTSTTQLLAQGLALSLASNPSHVGFSHHELLVDPPRSLGPLGPFTGYAAILKSSEFLKPAQQLLDELCIDVDTGSMSKFEKLQQVQREPQRGAVNSSASSDSFCGNCCESGGGSLISVQQPEMQQKKARLLNLREEVSYV